MTFSGLGNGDARGSAAERRVTARPGRLGVMARAFALSAAWADYSTIALRPKKVTDCVQVSISWTAGGHARSGHLVDTVRLSHGNRSPGKTVA